MVLASGGNVLLNVVVWTTYVPTVTLVGGAGNVVPVYTNNLGRYFVVGKTVFYTILLSGDGGADGAGTGVINIALPVTAGASVQATLTAGSFYIKLSTQNWSGIPIIGPSATTLTLFGPDPLGPGLLYYTGADQGNTDRLISISGLYEID